MAAGGDLGAHGMSVSPWRRRCQSAGGHLPPALASGSGVGDGDPCGRAQTLQGGRGWGRQRGVQRPAWQVTLPLILDLGKPRPGVRATAEALQRSPPERARTWAT